MACAQLARSVGQETAQIDCSVAVTLQSTSVGGVERADSDDKFPKKLCCNEDEMQSHRMGSNPEEYLSLAGRV